MTVFVEFELQSLRVFKGAQVSGMGAAMVSYRNQLKQETLMSTQTLLIIVVLVLLFGGGGFYFR